MVFWTSAAEEALLGAMRERASDERAQARLLVHMDGLLAPYHHDRAFRRLPDLVSTQSCWIDVA